MCVKFAPLPSRMISNFIPTIFIIFFQWTTCCLETVQTFRVHFLYDCPKQVPIVLWHGMGDSCCSMGSLGPVKKLLEDNISGVYVKSLEIGRNEVEDTINSYLMNVNEQIQNICDQVASDNTLKCGYNAIGFSQGGQFFRGLVQRCPEPPVKNLITLGAQHQGVYGYPHCPGENSTFCDYVRRTLNLGAYVWYVQKHLVQAQYWHNPLNEEEYKEKSLFLADINNERVKNESYKKNLSKLENFVMVKYSEDSMVDPRDSSWFGFYKPGQGKETFELQESPLYKEDWLGLKQLDSQGKLHFLEATGDHLQMDKEWFLKNIIEKFLK